MFNENNSEIRCSLRGRFQKEFALKRDKLFNVDIACVGDNVEFEMNRDGSGVINEVLERKNHISRKAPRIKGASVRGERLEQVVASNLDSLIIISSTQSPKFNNRLIDRFIVTAESSHIRPIIVINKIDLDAVNNFKKWSDLYKGIGYDVFETDAKKNIGTVELKNILAGKTNLIWGQSGVGKSSLLNSMFPNLKLKIGSISNYSSKGTHTTVTSLMRRVEDNTFVIDTPGIRELDPYGIKDEDLGHYFVEFKEYSDNCKFNTCTHNHEPGCAVVDAMNNGKLSPDRYQSYLNMLKTIEEDLFF